MTNTRRKVEGILQGTLRLSESLWLVCASKVYSSLGADIVLESFHSSTGF